MAPLPFMFILLLAYCNADKSIGFPEWISKEYWNENCLTEGVPTWIRGTFVRQQCGAFGGAKGSGRRSITHMYDCLGMMNAFKFDNGRVTFSSRYFDTEAYRKWAPRSRTANSEPARVTWKTLFTQSEGEPLRKDISQSGQTSGVVEASPSGGVWYASDPECTLQAYSDAPGLFKVRLRNGQLEELTSDDTWGNTDGKNTFPSDVILLHHSAHANSDKEGNLWGSMLTARKRSENLFDIDRIVYKLENATKKRTIIDGILSLTVDLRKCHETGTDKWTYTGTEEIGYVSEVAPMNSYLILIESPFIFNPCALLEKAQTVPKPFLSAWFKWHGSLVPLKFHIIARQGHRLKLTARARLPSPFVARIVNAVEQSAQTGGYIVIDALTHQDEKFLTLYYNVEYLASLSRSWPADAVLRRYAIDPNSGGLVEYSHTRLLPLGTPPVLSAEFVTINEARRGRGYSYAYIWVEPFADGSAIWKADMRNRNQPILRWVTEPGVYPAGQAAFVPRTLAKEDDGVLLVPAFNSNTKKGLIFILDASSMTRIGHVEAPDLITFGTYSTFVHTCGTDRPDKLNVFIAGVALACQSSCGTAGKIESCAQAILLAYAKLFHMRVAVFTSGCTHWSDDATEPLTIAVTTTTLLQLNEMGIQEYPIHSFIAYQHPNADAHSNGVKFNKVNDCYHEVPSRMRISQITAMHLTAIK